jgi:hypothetical protein
MRQQTGPSDTATLRRPQVRKRVAYLKECAGSANSPHRGSLAAKETARKRLPSYDRKTSQVELYTFVALGLVAAALVATTGLDSARFASRKDHLLDSAVSNTAIVEIKKSAGPTNLTIAQPPTLGERTRLEGTARPKS